MQQSNHEGNATMTTHSISWCDTCLFGTPTLWRAIAAPREARRG